MTKPSSAIFDTLLYCTTQNKDSGASKQKYGCPWTDSGKGFSSISTGTQLWGCKLNRVFHSARTDEPHTHSESRAPALTRQSGLVPCATSHHSQPFSEREPWRHLFACRAQRGLGLL